MPGLMFLLVVVVLVLEAVAFIRGLAAKSHLATAALTTLLGALMLWQLSADVAGLNRSGWANVAAQGGIGAQVLVAVAVLTLPLAGALHMIAARGGVGATRAVPFTNAGATALGALGAVGSFFITMLCFVE